MRSRLGVAATFLGLALAAALGVRAATRLAPPPPPEPAHIREAAELVAAWLDARRAGDAGRVAALSLPGLAERGTLGLSPTSNPHVEDYYVFPIGAPEQPPVRLQVVLHEVFTGEAYGALYSEEVTADLHGGRWLVVDWRPAGGAEVSVTGEGPLGQATVLAYEDVTGRRVTLDLARLPRRARPAAGGGEVDFEPRRFGPLALAPDGRFVAFMAAGPAASLLGVWDVAGARLYPVDVYFGAEVRDLHWSRDGAYLAATVQTPVPAGRVAVYRWPPGEAVPVPWERSFPGLSLQARRWEPLADALRVEVATPPGAPPAQAEQVGEWRLLLPELRLERVGPGPG